MDRTRKTYSRKYKLDIGKRLSEGEWATIKAASRDLGHVDSMLGKWKRQYEASIGARPGTKTAPALNGSAVAIHKPQPMPPGPSQIDELQAHIERLRDELDHAHQSIETLQKIVMALGRTLP